MSSLRAPDDQNDAHKNSVVHIVPNGNLASGGLAYASIRLAHEQARAGVDVYVFEVDSRKRVNAPWWCDAVAYVDGQSVLQRFVNLHDFLVRRRPVVHFHGVWYPQYVPYFLLVLFTNRPFVVSPHGSFEAGALNQKYFKKYLARKLYLNRLMSRVSSFWACSDKESNSLKREFPQVPVDIVPIGIDMPKINVHDRSISMSDERKIILVISRFNPGKGLLNLIHAWDLIRDENWRIIIAGPDEDNYQKKVELECVNLKLTRFFSFLGYVDRQQCDELYRSADIFALPSLSENFGIVVAEAMSYGVPVLTTNETPWTYVGIEHGCLCVDTDPNSISKGLRSLMNLTDDEKDAASNAAQLFIRDNFTWKKVEVKSNDLLKKYFEN